MNSQYHARLGPIRGYSTSSTFNGFDIPDAKII
jgi:hypothetical protein